MLYRNFLYAFLVLFFSQTIYAKVFLEDLKYYQSGDFFVTELQFDKPINENTVKVEYINQTLQINVPEGFLRSPKSQKVKSSNKVDLIYTYQASPNVLRSRIIYNRPFLAKKLKNRVQVTSQGRTLKVKVRDRVVPQFMKVDQEKIKEKLKVFAALNGSENQAQRAPTDIKTDMVHSRDLKPQKLTQDKKTRKLLSQINKDRGLKKEATTNNNTYLNWLVGLIALFSAFAGVYLFIRQSKIKKEDPLTESLQSDLRVLSEYPLGRNKSLLMVELEGEKMLLGLSSQSISLIKEWDSQATNNATDVHNANDVHDDNDVHNSTDIHNANNVHNANDVHDANDVHNSTDIHNANDAHDTNDVHDANDVHEGVEKSQPSQSTPSYHEDQDVDEKFKEHIFKPSVPFTTNKVNTLSQPDSINSHKVSVEKSPFSLSHLKRPSFSQDSVADYDFFIESEENVENVDLDHIKSEQTK